MEQCVGIPLCRLLAGYSSHLLNADTLEVSRSSKDKELVHCETSHIASESDSDSNIQLRIATISQDKLTANVKRQKYEGGFTIWESTWVLAAFIHTEVPPGDGKYAIDLGCGNGLCGIMTLKKGYNVLFQDLNWDVLEESVIANCLLNTSFRQLVQCQRQLRQKAPTLDSVKEDSPEVQAKLNIAKRHSTESTPGEISSVSESMSNDDVRLRFSHQEGDVYRHSTFVGANVANEQISLGCTNSDCNSCQDAAKHIAYELISCRWEIMPQLGKTVLNTRLHSCALIVASECLYRKENYESIAKVIQTYLCPQTGVAYIATKRLYFGMDGGTFEFISFINAFEAKPSLSAKITKSHTTPGSANVIDVIEVRLLQ
ncbi:histidine methyltransferase 1 homolog, putative [Babesia ovis]|uniref:protein-histidine N-methyltransferase n=1 Tax=Babesia ovis TaxID=5869 RepID=A0A9W5WWC3_BABOV|nr:histidine methyltransferase 1 homolog, putative [Babesia ovis]